jgi:hypothetical protein
VSRRGQSRIAVALMWNDVAMLSCDVCLKPAAWVGAKQSRTVADTADYLRWKLAGHGGYAFT